MKVITERIEVLKGDITLIAADAIVNAANSSLMGGGGVDGAIHRAGGKKILEECMAWVKQFGQLPAGSAMITSGGALAAKYVIHTVGPVWRDGRSNEDDLLQLAYMNSLQLADKYQLKTIAFPNISTGVYHFPKERAAIIALSTVTDFLKSNSSVSKVTFVCFDGENFNLYTDQLDEWQQQGKRIL